MTGPRRRAAKPVVAVDVEYEWIDTEAGLQDLIEEASKVDTYAIDTEFLRERTYYPRLALVQIGFGDRIALIDPLRVSIAPLVKLLESDAVAVFHAADQDLEVLEYACGAIPRRMFDTQLAAGFLGFSTPSLVSLAGQVLGVRLSKGDRLTDWTMRPLTDAQKAYAASDVSHLLALKDLLVEELRSVGRLEWLENETEVVRTRPRGHHDANRAWWRLKDGRVLRGHDRLIAQELCAWREHRAQSEDRPVRFILADLAVLAIAQAKPTTITALSGLRGVDGRIGRGALAKEVLEVIANAMAMSIDELQVPETDEFDRLLRPALTLVSAWISQLAQDARVDQSILATRSDLVRFLRGDEDARLRYGWRATLLGENLGKLVNGGAALAFEPSGRLVLEHRSNDPIQLSMAIPSATWTEQPVPSTPSVDIE
jgi:ribonuclease D